MQRTPWKEKKKREEKKDATVSLYLWKYFYSYKKGDRMPQSQIQGYIYIKIEFKSHEKVLKVKLYV